MPELPEVEVIRQGLARCLSGRRITAIAWSGQKLRLPVPRGRLIRWCKGATILSVERRAKYLLLRLDNSALLIIHLGMSGRLGLFAADARPARHDHLRWRLDDDRELRLNDPRRFGSVQVLEPGGEQEGVIFRGPGREPFATAFSTAYLLEKAARRQQPVKNFLMDGRVVAGIGNIYASEILFAAGIAPAKPAAGLTSQAWQKIIVCSRQVLERAIASGGTTIADYVDSSGRPGYFQLELAVYGRAGQACRACGVAIQRQVMAGRATYFCPRCQG